MSPKADGRQSRGIGGRARFTVGLPVRVYRRCRCWRCHGDCRRTGLVGFDFLRRRRRFYQRYQRAFLSAHLDCTEFIETAVAIRFKAEPFRKRQIEARAEERRLVPLAILALDQDRAIVHDLPVIDTAVIGECNLRLGRRRLRR